MKSKKRHLLLGIGLIVSFITLLAYLPALQNGFVNWDDNTYLYENNSIRATGIGLLKWSFTSEVAALWHPLTVYSHALAFSIFGLRPWGHHFVNILVHSFNTFLVFILTVRLISLGCSLKDDFNVQRIFAGIVTSFLFGLHPMHVESVAWISERKDVLYAFFYLSSVILYIEYHKSQGSKRHIYYLICLLSFILALLSKPMAVTLPILLIIFDYYPLGRLKSEGRLRGLAGAIIEKIPFFIFSAATSQATIWASHTGGALGQAGGLPNISRLFSIIHAYVFYLSKLLMPYSLAPLYPQTAAVGLLSLHYLGPFALFTAISIFCFVSLKKTKVFSAAWLYYIVTLTPAIGIIRVGEQAAADRYTYLPSLGPFILVGLGTGILFGKLANGRQKAFFVALILISILLVSKTERQIAVWRDSITLWSHEIQLFSNVDKAYFNRGEAYGKIGEFRHALDDSSKAIELNPTYADAYYNRGTVYSSLGECRQAINDFNLAIELKSRFYEKAYNNRGICYDAVGEHQKAISDFNRAVELSPRDEVAYSNRGNVYFSSGNYQMAIKDYDKAIELSPSYVDAYNNRGYVYYILGMDKNSINDLKKAVEIDPGYAEAYYNLGLVYSRIGGGEPALSYYRKAASLGSKEAISYLKKMNN